MTECIIHIGMHKTGTTSIQRSLRHFKNEKYLIYDNNTARANHSSVFFSLVDKKMKGKSYGELKKNNYKELQGLIKQLNGRKLLISGEGMMYLNFNELNKLNEILSNLFEKLIIVGYVRPPSEYMTSVFQHRIKSGRSEKISPINLYPGYQEKFSNYDKIFGCKNVNLWKFDPNKFPERCVVRDFCDRLGIDLLPEKILRENESLSRQSLALIYIYSTFRHEQIKINRKEKNPYKKRTMMLAEQLMGIGTEKFRFSPDIIRPVLEKNRADIEWMEERLGESLEEDLGEHQPGDIRNESDLLMLDPVAVEKLLDMLGKRAPKGNRGKTPEEVALLVQALMEGDRGMKVNELIEDLKVTSPEVLEGITDAQAGNILTGLLMHINKQIKDTDEGVISFSKLGKFRIRNVEKEVEGRKENKRRIIFNPIDPEKDEKRTRQSA